VGVHALQQPPDEPCAHSAGQVHLPQRATTPGSTSTAPGSAATSSTTCSSTRSPSAAAPDGSGRRRPAQVWRPPRQRPPPDDEAEVTEATILTFFYRAHHSGAQIDPAWRSRSVVERSPTTVRRAGLGAVGPHPDQGFGDQVGSRVGHPAEQHQAGLTPPEAVHPASLSPAVSVSKHTPGVSAQIQPGRLSSLRHTRTVGDGPDGQRSHLRWRPPGPPPNSTAQCEPAGPGDRGPTAALG